jgi:hypothetical protein
MRHTRALAQFRHLESPHRPALKIDRGHRPGAAADRVELALCCIEIKRHRSKGLAAIRGRDLNRRQFFKRRRINYMDLAGQRRIDIGAAPGRIDHHIARMQDRAFGSPAPSPQSGSGAVYAASC